MHDYCYYLQIVAARAAAMKYGEISARASSAAEAAADFNEFQECWAWARAWAWARDLRAKGAQGRKVLRAAARRKFPACCCDLRQRF